MKFGGGKKRIEKTTLRCSAPGPAGLPEGFHPASIPMPSIKNKSKGRHCGRCAHIGSNIFFNSPPLRTKIMLS